MHPSTPGSFDECVSTVCGREREEKGSAEEWSEALEEGVEGGMREVESCIMNLATVWTRTSGHMLWHKKVIWWKVEYRVGRLTTDSGPCLLGQYDLVVI